MPLKMAVIGAGHFGQYHAEKVANLSNVTLVAIADINRDQATKIAAKYNVEAVTDFTGLFGNVDAVCIVVPTRSHFMVASACLKQGIHVLLEKPITYDVCSAKKLINLSEQHKCVLQIGHLVRFSGVAKALRRQVKRPLYIESVRVAPFKSRGTDVSVILDLMVHDLDLILSLVDSPVSSLDAAGAPVISDYEDIVSARIKFENGCIANITASRISLKTERKMRIFERDAYVTVDFDSHCIRTINKAKSSLLPGLADIESKEQKYDEVDALEQEIISFVDAIDNNTPPLVSGVDGVNALKTALEITKSLNQHKELVKKNF